MAILKIAQLEPDRYWDMRVSKHDVQGQETGGAGGKGQGTGGRGVARWTHSTPGVTCFCILVLRLPLPPPPSSRVAMVIRGARSLQEERAIFHSVTDLYAKCTNFVACLSPILKDSSLLSAVRYRAVFCNAGVISEESLDVLTSRGWRVRAGRSGVSG